MTAPSDEQVEVAARAIVKALSLEWLDLEDDERGDAVLVARAALIAAAAVAPLPEPTEYRWRIMFEGEPYTSLTYRTAQNAEARIADLIRYHSVPRSVFTLERMQVTHWEPWVPVVEKQEQDR